MARQQKTKKTATKLEELVVIAYPDDLEQAKDFEATLKANEIPAMIKQQTDPEDSTHKTITVMVPEDFADEANVIIESQNAYDDFYDISLEDEDDFGIDPFDEDF